MAFDFPNSPSEGTQFAPSGGPVYVYTGGVWRMQGSGQVVVVTAEARNRLVNPAMAISQQFGTGGTVATGDYAVDQWSFVYTSNSFANQVSGYTTPYGSPYVVSMAAMASKPTLAATDVVHLLQPLEGIRIADWLWGVGGGLERQVVLGFHVYASLAGTYSVAVRNAAKNRCWVGTYVIAGGETYSWVRRTLVIPGDTTGTWPITNAKGLEIDFTFAAGANFVAPTTGWQAGAFIAAPGQINGVASAGESLMIGDVGLYLDPLKTGVAPRWQMPDEAEELRACRRYWQNYTNLYNSFAYSAAVAFWGWYVNNVQMRTVPTLSYANITYNNASGLIVGPQITATSFTTRASTSAAGAGSVTFDAFLTARM